MSKSKINLLITSSVMSAVCLAGMSNVSMAVEMPSTDANLNTITAEINQSSHSILAPLNAQGQRRYIVRLVEPAVAMYNGVGEFAAIPRRADNKIEVNSAAVTSYVNHLKQQQNTLLADLSSELGRQVNALLSYQYSINGFAVDLTAEEAAVVKRNGAVADIQADRLYSIDTDAGPTLIGANNVWNGMAPASGTAHGEGIVIGTLDTGINSDHPSFADIGGDAYDHTNPLGSGNYLGVCDPSNVDQYIDTYTCNDKLIGGFDFINDLVPDDGSFDIPGPEDENGHGSHTASTSGGNVVLTASANGVNDIAISGVAPHANVIMFDICFNSVNPGGCAGAATVASIDQILADGVVDVVNYSISGGTNPWSGAVELAFLSATDSGVFVSASAGNAGPGPGTLGHLEPWTSSVGASTHDRAFENLMSITGPVIDPALEDVAYNTSNGPAAAADIAAGVQYAGEVDAANFEGCVAFPASSFDGLVALISRGSCSFADKVANATAAGAIAVVVHNNAAGALNMNVGDVTTIPSFSILQADGDAMATYIGANAGATILIELPVLTNSGQADAMAGFSSRGPSPFEYNKPDVTGPGVNILAAFNDDTVAPSADEEYGIISGTSMSSPHNAGTAALLKELHPTWSVPEIKSALMLTSVTAGVTKEDGVTPADPFDRGAGRIQVDVASSTGLVMDETAFRFLLADPANGGDPKDLNVASYKNNNCVGTCSFQRKFTSVAAGPVDYDVSLTGMTGTVNPTSFTANPGQTITIDVDIDGAAMVPGATTFGELMISTGTTVISDTVTITPAVAIADATYDGTLANMACSDLTVAGASAGINGLSVDLGIDHTWIGDLAVKLVNPDGDELGLMSRPGVAEGADDGNTTVGFGDSSNLLASSSLNFNDASSNSAETMGDVGGSSAVVCQDNAVCDFAPTPDSIAQPPATLAEMVTGTIDGDWSLCVGDSGNGDTGTVESVTLNFLAEESKELHMPLVVIGFPEAPDITVNPTSLAATLDSGTTTDVNLNISNSDLAGADLNWTFGSGSLPGGDPFDYINQINPAPTTGFPSGTFASNGGSGVFSADDFTLTETASIENMRFEGFANGTTLDVQASGVSVYIYADNAGAPQGDPEDGMNLEIYNLDLPIADANLDITGNNIDIDIAGANGGTALEIPAGTYWILIVVDNVGAVGDATRWNWFASGSVVAGSPSHVTGPAFGIPAWTALPAFLNPPNPDFEQLSFSISGSIPIDCGAPWITTSSAGSTLAPSGDIDVTVTLDASGLAPGVYDGTLCVDSDDPDEPQILVPVAMTVEGESDLIFADGFE